MNQRTWSAFGIPVAILASATILAFVSSRPAFKQKCTEVFVREPGRRLLEGPRSVDEEATKHILFAWLSAAAYGKIKKVSPTVPITVASSSASPSDAQYNSTTKTENDFLTNEGWKLWGYFPDNALSKKIRKSNLRVEVWEKKNEPSSNEPSSIAVAFGGTVFDSGKDWKSNFRWFLPFRKDEYTDIVKVFCPAFVLEFSRRAKKPEGAHLCDATIYSTGHSLGGGLAQQFAYALPINSSMPKVKYVYAFDPSPVTGFYSVNRQTRNYNKCDLSIDRIYERGEVVAILRSFTSFFFPPSAANPRIRAVRYSLFYPANPISGHSIRKFASKLQVSAMRETPNSGALGTAQSS